LGSVPKTEKGSYSNDTARRLRYAFLEEAAQEIGANLLATAHTADDQAETVLGRVLRGTSVDGIAGIPARRVLSPELLVIRPLLSQTRAEIKAYCAAQGVTPRHDPSNDKEVFPRVRLRRRLPELARDFNPRLTDALIRLADHAAQDSALLSELADALWEKCLIPSDPPSIHLNAVALRDAPPALRRRVLLRALRHATGDRAEEAATGAFVARLETLLETGKGGVSLPGGPQARITKKILTLARPLKTFKKDAEG
jgi:tRNA(Ile)-lysidine synthase